jgi:hypothetical protein
MTMHVCIQLLALEHFCWELSDHPLYSPDLVLSNDHLFTYLMNWLGSQCFNNNEKLMDGVKTWLSSQVTDFFDIGIQKLIPHCDKCLSSGSDYVEKQLKYVHFLYIIKLFFLIACFVNSSLVSELFLKHCNSPTQTQLYAMIFYYSSSVKVIHKATKETLLAT